MSLCRRGAARRASVSVEFSLTLPLLLLVVFASIEFGRMNVIRHTVDNAAYEAARRAIVPGATAAEAESVARDIMRSCGAQGVSVTIDPPLITWDVPAVSVTVSAPANQNGFLAPQFFRDRALVGQVTLRREDL